MSSGGMGRAGVFRVVVRGHSKRTKQGKSRAPMAFWVHAVSDGAGGWQLPVPLGVVVEVVAALGGGGGVSLDEERFWVGGEAVLGF